MRKQKKADTWLILKRYLCKYPGRNTGRNQGESTGCTRNDHGGTQGIGEALNFKINLISIMKNEDRIVELLSESLQRQDRMIEQFEKFGSRLEKLENSFDRIDNRLERVESAIERVANLMVKF